MMQGDAKQTNKQTNQHGKFTLMTMQSCLLQAKDNREPEKALEV